MENKDLKKECSIIVSSCDAFSDVWKPFFTLFFRYWNDCPFSVYLISEKKVYDDKRIIPILLGEDKKWATNIQTAVGRINTPYIIYLQEDYLLESKVDSKRIIELLNILKKNRAACLRLFPVPQPDKKFNDSKIVGEISKNSKYSISLQATIWDKSILEKFIIPGESGWDMELKGSLRASEIKEPFLSVYVSALDYFYTTAIKKGVWFYDAIKLCEREGIKIDKSVRRIETFKHYILRRTRIISPLQKIERLIKRIKRRLFLTTFLPINLFLIIKNNKQIKDFYLLRKRFFELYNLITKKDISKFTTKHWEVLNKNFEDYLIKNNINFGFLRNRIIGYTMFVSGGGSAMRSELNFLEENYSKEELKKYLEEEAVGFPIIMNRRYKTSHNSIRHLYHISRFLNKTSVKPESINNVIEWGGGYGNLAKIFLRLKNNSNKTTYTIIDTPLFSCIQWLYLSVVLGRENVNLIKKDTDEIISGTLNLVPLGFVDKIKDKPDLFISTWALSESSVFSQEYVAKKDFYGARHILIGYQDNTDYLPNAGGIGEIVEGVRRNAIKEDIEFLGGNHYIFE